MKNSRSKNRHRGYISFLLVISTGAILTLLTLFAYRRAMAAHAVQSQVQLRVDYGEKEEAILRSIVAITPNRAIRAMQSGSNATAAVSNPLRWQNIFTESLLLANAGKSISDTLVASLNIPGLLRANSGDSNLSNPATIFRAIAPETGYLSGGINRSLGPGYPPPLTSNSQATIDRDPLYPIITNNKVYGSLAQPDLNSPTLNGDGTNSYGLPVTSYPRFNRLKYPDINFGYAKPGDPFVAKRNWWAFSLNVGGSDTANTFLARARRDYVMSIYEIPSQLSISASSFLSLGQFASGEAWQNVTIDGGIFAGKAVVEGDTAINALSSRRGMTLSSGTTIGGQSFSSSPFTPGVREAHQMTEGTFFPVSLASESGRAAFVPINRGAAFFDRIFHPLTEPDSVSTTTWNDYSVGARQCAMQLDISRVVKSSNPANITPTHLKFSYMKAGVRVLLPEIKISDHPPGYYPFWSENGSYNFGTDVVDVAYGRNGAYNYKYNVTGSIAFNNPTFGDPLVGTFKAGYLKLPFEVSKFLPDGRVCIAVYPQRFKAFLRALGADTTAMNHSLVVNVDYKTNIGDTYPTNPLPTNPLTPYLPTDYGVILNECADLTSFTKGFSLVTNFRLYIGDDFNIVPATPPTGYTPTGLYFPPCSLFAPEKRYGVEVDPFAVTLGGQIGSLASDTLINPIRPLDSTAVSGSAIASDKITVNLRPITHPAELPPVTMMNWLILLEELRR